ncbi:hypothetical protein Ddye_025875 [Dipteronia dyeriana]|uniref:RNase H type-1 domain-containing protein n=1 Tax=Dipteronia dyeriana TaxID=168575 RepID=A0AAD9TM62_9ROSI|nr:hypothetical protein Ddye_025875 [Dipteronia dyeriana]
MDTQTYLIQDIFTRKIDDLVLASRLKTEFGSWNGPLFQQVSRNGCGFMKGLRCDDKFSFRDFLQSCFHRLQSDEVALLCIIMWRIWFLPNNKVHCWEGSLVLVNVYTWAVEFLNNFRIAITVDGGNRGLDNSTGVVWQDPSVGIFKVNCDAALDMNNKLVGIGLVVRDHYSSILALCAQRIHACYSPLVAEAVAVLRGINFVLKTGVFPLVVETDALGVVQMVKIGSSFSVDIGLVIGGILARLQDSKGATMGFVPKKANSVTHTLLKLALHIGEDLF